ncbi:hypothetical protein ADL19_23210 [Streptomyces purpurogeneiscleroticus]|nr:hypothetical protein ADL19_23210 [Streptomyces purpurogeneiscleroticus]
MRTRKPTGRVPWPLILIEGGEKAGKSWACAQFSTSPRIGQMYWIDLGEGAADEYGAIPGADYDIIEPTGEKWTWAEIQAAVDAVKAEAQRTLAAGKPPVVLVIDSMTAEWDMLKDWASDKARQRHNAKARKYGKPQLAADEEPKISMDLWNEAGGRHRKLMTTLMTFPGIVLLTARGKDVAALDDKGAPIANTKEYKVEGHKTLGFDVSCWIRLDRSKPGTIVGLRSVHLGVRPGYDDPLPLARDWSVEGVVFDMLRCDPAQAHTRDLAELQAAEPELVDQLLEQIRSVATREQYGAAVEACKAATGLTDDEFETLKNALAKRRAELVAAAEPKNPGNDAARRRMMALFGQAEITDRDERLAYVGNVVGHDVGSTNELTDAEVREVCDRLERWIAQQTPPTETELAGAGAR